MYVKLIIYNHIVFQIPFKYEFKMIRKEALQLQHIELGKSSNQIYNDRSIFGFRCRVRH